MGVLVRFLGQSGPPLPPGPTEALVGLFDRQLCEKCESCVHVCACVHMCRTQAGAQANLCSGSGTCPPPFPGPHSSGPWLPLQPLVQVLGPVFSSSSNAQFLARMDRGSPCPPSQAHGPAIGNQPSKRWSHWKPNPTGSLRPRFPRVSAPHLDLCLSCNSCLPRPR